MSCIRHLFVIRNKGKEMELFVIHFLNLSLLPYHKFWIYPSSLKLSVSVSALNIYWCTYLVKFHVHIFQDNLVGFYFIFFWLKNPKNRSYSGRCVFIKESTTKSFQLLPPNNVINSHYTSSVMVFLFVHLNNGSGERNLMFWKKESGRKPFIWLHSISLSLSATIENEKSWQL